jgi:hypothetical protein
MTPVPEIYRGLWRRRVLETSGQVDLRTTVYWLQTSSLYADVRIPADRGRRGRLARMTQAGRRALARQQGFAGALEVDGDVLTWQRWLDYQPAAAPDVGRVHFDGSLLVEHGVHAAYREEWQRVQAVGEDCVALVLEDEFNPNRCPLDRAGILVALEGYFMIALARPEPLPPAADLAALVDSEIHSLDAKRCFLNCAIELGVRHGGGRWELQLSTLPHHEGLGFREVHGTWRRDGAGHYLQSSPCGARRRWRTVEQGSRFHGLPGTE